MNEDVFDPGEVVDLIENMTLHQSESELFMMFLIPALNGSLDAGMRRFNWLWCRNAPDAATICSFLTGRDGQRHHASVPPGELSEAPLAYLHRMSLERVPLAMSQLVAAMDAPFLQAISDALSPSFAKGRIALVGDAACTLRPHTGSGTSKAAGDAVSLAEALAASDAQHVVHVVHALDDWATQRRGAVEPLLQKGSWLAQSFGLGNLPH